jgi:predicted RNA binding protein YcfA (HicA-like mRNA interferase family)
MRLPRDLSGVDLAKLLQKLGYQITRQAGSHIRLTTQQHEDYEWPNLFEYEGIPLILD